jgi:hypothetical protein
MANGSRERAPDDRLREAIRCENEKTGLLRRIPPSPFELPADKALLAMTMRAIQ